MSRLQELINELCPNGVEYKTIGDISKTLKKETLKTNELIEGGKYPVINSGREIYGFYNNYNNYSASYAINYESNLFYYSQNEENQWWIIGFGQEVKIKSYQIISEPACYWISKWKASTSLNGNDWKVIDTPKEGFPNSAIKILNQTAKARFFRIDSLYSSCGYYMAFRYIKFYGSLVSSRDCTNNRKKVFRIDILLIISLIYF